MSAESAAAIREGLALAQWNETDLWRACLGVGGDYSTSDIADLTSGRRTATRLDHNILASALNDHFTERGDDHPVRYWDQLAAG